MKRGAFSSGISSPNRLSDGLGELSGLVTGYYEPVLVASRTPSARFRHPIYGVPEDLLVVDLSAVYPELARYRLRGRREGRRVVPYHSRAEIDAGAPLPAPVLAWADDPLAVFLLHVQGSGRLDLVEGGELRVGYAEQNGHPYVAIGKKLVDAGELRVEEADLPGIEAWARRHPERLAWLLAQNPSYVFIRELAPTTGTKGTNDYGPIPDGPPGSLGVPLTAGRSLAVDPRSLPLGAPVYLATTWPGETQPLTRLMAAQDTGGAIKGPGRVDVFWGSGEEAKLLAGRMRSRGRLWLLWSKDAPPPKPSP